MGRPAHIGAAAARLASSQAPPAASDTVRRRSISPVAVLTATLAAALAGARFVSPAAGADNLGRAQAVYSSLERYFGRPGTLRRDGHPGAAASSAWSLSQELAAALGLAEADPSFRADVRADLAALRLYQDGPGGYLSYPRLPYGAGGHVYYDDNDWLGLDLVRAYRLLGDGAILEQAERIFAFVSSGWDRDTTHACPGGVFWTQDPANTDRNAVSTANAALLALALYRETHVPSYLHWARTMYAWVDRCLASPDGLYADHLTLTGGVDAREWRYNQGAMIAAGAELYSATGDTSYLERATGLADLTLARFAAGEFDGQPLIFAAIFFRDLKTLAAVAADPAYTGAAQGFADRVWRAGRDRRTGLVAATGTASLLDEAAVVDLYAELADA